MSNSQQSFKRPFNGSFWVVVITVITVIANLAINASTFWASGKFVSTEKYEKDKLEQAAGDKETNRELKDIAVTLQRIKDFMEVNQSQAEDIKELQRHERERK
jgi:hypothetical protein